MSYSQLRCARNSATARASPAPPSGRHASRQQLEGCPRFVPADRKIDDRNMGRVARFRGTFFCHRSFVFENVSRGGLGSPDHSRRWVSGSVVWRPELSNSRPPHSRFKSQHQPTWQPRERHQSNCTVDETPLSVATLTTENQGRPRRSPYGVPGHGVRSRILQPRVRLVPTPTPLGRHGAYCRR